MARIALIDASAGTATAVEAVAGEHEVRSCSLGAAASDADLAIVDYAGKRRVEATYLADLDANVAVLLLVDARVSVDESLEADGVVVLRKPVDLFELRANVGALLASNSQALSAAGRSQAARENDKSGRRRRSSPGDEAPAHGHIRETALSWLAHPLLPTAVVPTVAAARRLPTSIWIVGEVGSGREQVAAALLRPACEDADIIAWHDGESFEAAQARCGSDRSLLVVADVEARTLADQQRLENYLARPGARRVLAISGDDPAQAVLAGRLSRSLYHLLARLTVRLPPLRERRSEIAAVAAVLLADIAASILPGSAVRLAPGAIEKLESYPWPGNIVELQGVLTRSLAAHGIGDGPVVIEAASLRFEPGLCAPEVAPASSSPAARSGVVVSLASAARRQDDAAPVAVPAAATTTEPTAVATAIAVATETAIEPVLASLAHDLRNPMATIKTFASLAAAADGDGSELARLAVQACSSIDTHLELLHRYANMPDAKSPGLTSIDLVAVLVEWLGTLDDPCPTSMEARQPVWVRMNPHHASFIAEALLEEARQRLEPGEQACIDAGAQRGTLEVRIPVAEMAIDNLDKWVQGQALPWRLSLAREVARRGGGDVVVVADRDELRVMWQAPAAEDAGNGEQADRADRRRRSRSS